MGDKATCLAFKATAFRLIAASTKARSCSSESNQRSALDTCKEQEDAVVTAVLAVQIAEEEARWRREQRTVAARAGAWAASVTAYVVDPVTSWLGTWSR